MSQGSFRFHFSLHFAKIVTSSWCAQGSARPGNIGTNGFHVDAVNERLGSSYEMTTTPPPINDLIG